VGYIYIVMETPEYIKSIETIQSLYEKYKDDPYMFVRLNQYISYQLPNILETMHHAYEHRQIKTEEMMAEQELFIQSFLNNNKYYYAPITEKFLYYDEIHYQVYNEDDILHHILTSITKDKQLVSWKQRTKTNIMKRIKTNNLLKSIPNSDTIQHVIELFYPALFSSKTEVKYFLTILGDNLLKKNDKIIHFIHPKTKSFLRELNNYSQIFIGSPISQTFKHKYHEHDYINCRMVYMNESARMENLWFPIISQNILDIICVSAHYSIRYGSSDLYILSSSNDPVLKDNTFYLKDTTPEKLIELFVEEYIQTIPNNTLRTSVNTESSSITWKNMQYLWKHFLEAKRLPAVIFQQNLKCFLIKKMENLYDEKGDVFNGICSKYLPSIQRFLQFWNETMVYDETEIDYEIDEIASLYKKWCEQSDLLHYLNISDKQILDLIFYFFPQVEIEQDKFIYKMRNTMWNKKIDVQIALENIREIMKLKTDGSPKHMNICIYDAYETYCKQKDPLKIIVSKSYFEKYIYENLSEYIIDDKILNLEHLHS